MPSHTGAGGANAPTKAQIQSSELVYADATGSGGNFAVTLSPAVAAYTDGMIIAFSANHAPASTATLNVNSLGAKTIKKYNDQDLVSGDIENGQRVVVQYDADADVFEMVSQVGNLPTSSTTTPGIIEAATAAETTTGTDATRAVTPDGLAGSDFGKRVIQVKVFDDATAATTGDGKAIFMIPVELNGYNLVDCEAYVTGTSSSGALTIQIRNVTQAADMLSTAITIDQSENSSLTAATPPVIDTNNDDVATGDLIAIDVDGAGTSAEGLGVVLTFQLP
jgi:hypothetical protein